MTRVFIWKNNSPQEWEEISFSAFSKARRNGCFTGRFFVETVKMFRDEDDRIIMECSRKDFEKYQQEDRHSRYLQEHEKSRSIFPASHVGDRDGTEEGYQDTDLFVDESVDTAEQAIQNLLLEDLHQALLKLSPAERDPRLLTLLKIQSLKLRILPSLKVMKVMQRRYWNCLKIPKLPHCSSSWQKLYKVPPSEERLSLCERFSSFEPLCTVTKHFFC